MPVAATYPGVYIEEVPSSVHTITAVATSVAAFIDLFRKGPIDEAVHIFSMGDFEREFGGLHTRSEASYAIQQFFLNGGTEAWVVRTASGAFAAAEVEMLGEDGVTKALTLRAGPAGTNEPGEWGNSLRVVVDHPVPDAADRFDLTILLVDVRDGQQVVVRSEIFRDLSVEAGPRSVQAVLNDEFSGSELVQVTTVGDLRPAQTGTTSAELHEPLQLSANKPGLAVTIGDAGSKEITLAEKPTTIADAARQLENAIRAARPDVKAFSQATVTAQNGRLRILAGPSSPGTTVVFSPGSGKGSTADLLQLSPGSTVSGVISGPLTINNPVSGSLDVNIGGLGMNIGFGPANTLADVPGVLENVLRGADADPGFAQARVLLHQEGADTRLLVLAGKSGAEVVFTNPTGTAADLKLEAATKVTALLSGVLAPVPAITAGAKVDVTIGANGPHTATLPAAGTADTIAAALQTAIRQADADAAYQQVRVLADGDHFVVTVPDAGGTTVTFAATPDATTLNELGLAGVKPNVQLYALGGGAVANTAQSAGAKGADGDPPSAEDLIGLESAKSGMYALEDVDLFNILCIPRSALISGDLALDADAAVARTKSAMVISVATDYCERRRAFFIVDTPIGVDDLDEVQKWMQANATLRHKNSAIYFPRLQIPDPLNGFRLRSVGASGTMAGLYARTDAARGVWKAPAGTEASLVNVQQLEYLLTDLENGALNPLGINCLRNFPVYGNVAWGARTLKGADQIASEWKYVPVRRLALFLEESLYRGTQWVVFEPNDEPLWAQIRLNLGAFMHTLFSQGAFQGRTQREAYFVKCDRETTTQNDIDLGRVNIVVGFAPLKPAEFVIIKLQQIAGAIQT